METKFYAFSEKKQDGFETVKKLGEFENEGDALAKCVKAGIEDLNTLTHGTRNLELKRNSLELAGYYISTNPELYVMDTSIFETFPDYAGDVKWNNIGELVGVRRYSIGGQTDLTKVEVNMEFHEKAKPFIPESETGYYSTFK